jgi:hypothetical protein
MYKVRSFEFSSQMFKSVTRPIPPHTQNLITMFHLRFQWHWTRIKSSDIQMKTQQTTINKPPHPHSTMSQTLNLRSVEELKSFTSRPRWANKMWIRALTMLRRNWQRFLSEKQTRSSQIQIGSLKRWFRCNYLITGSTKLTNGLPSAVTQPSNR